MDNKYMPYQDWEFVNKIVGESNWILAKSMPENPHQYMLRRESDDAEFVRFVLIIRKYGFRMKYGRSWYICLRVNDFYYWTMGCPIHNCPKTGTILINRKECRLAGDYSYDAIAADYESEFSNDVYADEDVQTADLISRHNTSGKTLEIGCGSGMVTRNLIFNREQYVGIDPSTNMLEKFHAIEQLTGLKTINTDFESFATREKFNFVFATYGAASYVRPEFWNRLSDFLERDGTFLLMFYADGYTPATHIYSLMEMPYFNAAEFKANCPLSVKESRAGNYAVLEGMKK
jgi:hypothetical protein